MDLPLFYSTTTPPKISTPWMTTASIFDVVLWLIRVCSTETKRRTVICRNTRKRQTTYNAFNHLHTPISIWKFHRSLASWYHCSLRYSSSKFTQHACAYSTRSSMPPLAMQLSTPISLERIAIPSLKVNRLHSVPQTWHTLPGMTQVSCPFAAQIWQRTPGICSSTVP